MSRTISSTMLLGLCSRVIRLPESMGMGQAPLDRSWSGRALLPTPQQCWGRGARAGGSRWRKDGTWPGARSARLRPRRISPNST